MAAYTQAQLDALQRSIAEGVKRVEYEDRNVIYRSLDEMLKLERRMETCLGLGPVKPIRKVIAHSKGFEQSSRRRFGVNQ